jgi:xanthine dehydrogenase iron-sulfur cluster and FAD-binding subunit A
VTLRATRAEQALLGARPSPAAAHAAREALLSDIAPIDDIRSDREYRQEVSVRLLAQFLQALDARFGR